MNGTSRVYDRAQIDLKPGDQVDQTDDFGNVHRRTVKYAPWQLGHGDWVVGLIGIRGGYALRRVQPVAKESVA